MLFELILKQAKEREKYFKNYLKYAKKIKEEAIKSLGDCKIYVFGSVVEGKAIPASDIDLLIVSKNTPKTMKERSELATKLLKAVGIFSPFELHLVNEEEFEWYKRFVKKLLPV